MVGLSIPSDFPLSSLVGQELTQVCIGAYHVRLSFYRQSKSPAALPKWEPGAAIDIEAGFELRSPGKDPQCATNDNIGETAGCLTTLLQHAINSITQLPNNELLLVFSSDVELRLLTDPIGFESYHLHVDGQSVDVTICK